MKKLHPLRDLIRVKPVYYRQRASSQKGALKLEEVQNGIRRYRFSQERNTYVTKMDKEGNILHQENLKNEGGLLEAFVDSLTGEDEIVLEATGNWYHFYELVEDRALRITLSHPAKTRAIASARIKTDKIDSAMLAHLLRADLIPAAYIPERETRDVREVLRYRGLTGDAAHSGKE